MPPVPRTPRTAVQPLQTLLSPAAALPALLLVAGTAMLLGAGNRHPRIGLAMGPIGSDEFFRSFAHEALHTPQWAGMHLLILFGPVLWAIGAAGLVRALPERVAVFGEAARAALLLAAGAWAMAFVFDGSRAPARARAIEDAGATAGGAVITPFRANQLAVARLGMISVVLFAAAIVSLGVAHLATARTLSWRWIVGALCLMAGAWPLIDAARGEFVPGPFTSPHWKMTALALGLSMVLLAAAHLGGLVDQLEQLDDDVVRNGASREELAQRREIHQAGQHQPVGR
jgi:hypothetical protein